MQTVASVVALLSLAVAAVCVHGDVVDYQPPETMTEYVYATTYGYSTLPRAVMADVNGDGLNDWVVSECHRALPGGGCHPTLRASMIYLNTGCGFVSNWTGHCDSSVGRAAALRALGDAEVLDFHGASLLLGIPPSDVEDLVDAGVLPAVRLGSHLRLHRARVLELFA